MTPMRHAVLAPWPACVGGGKQTPGFLGVGRLYVISRKFISAEGGLRRLVWMPKELKEYLHDPLQKRAEELGVPDLVDKIADESVGTDVESVMAWVEQVNHPCLTLPSLLGYDLGERAMAVTALEIYKHLPKTNCAKCRFPDLPGLRDAALAEKDRADKCPEVTEAGRAALDGAAAPPIRLITVGAGDRRLQVGNETVLFRHEQTFYHPTGVAVILSDTLADAELGARIQELRGLTIERVGVQMTLDLIAVRSDSGNATRFAAVVARSHAKRPTRSF